MEMFDVGGGLRTFDEALNANLAGKRGTAVVGAVKPVDEGSG